jgi:murein DD-endopeptidase MepM/ murein hydrolase activator NlpD
MRIQRLFTLKKGMLALAVGLTVVGVSVLHERMGRALEMSLPLEPAPSGLEALAPIPLEKFESISASATPTVPSSQSRESASLQPTSKPSDARIAVDTKSSDTSRTEVSMMQVDPAHIAAVSEWQGASFPVENFQTYTSPFGYRRSPEGGYSQEFHYGLDLAAPEGSYIRNWWSGTVVEVSDDSNCGTSVVVESGPWLHIYCHMSGYVDSDGEGRYMIDRDGGLKIYEGQIVAAGDRIGRVGMTGRTTGPHLHWGLKYNENWVDPAFVLQAMYYSQGSTAQSVQ